MRSSRGSSPLELAIIAPAVLLVIFGVVQAGLYYHARQTAHRAAEQGVERGRVYDGSQADGVDAARSFLQRMGNSVEAPQVSAARGQERMRVEVTGKVVTLVPGLALDVRAEAHGPVERWSSP